MARQHVESGSGAAATWRHLASPLRPDVAGPPASTDEVRRLREMQQAQQQAQHAQQPDGLQRPAPGPAAAAQLTWQQRFTSAAGASVVSALVVNPLDVVKTRMQAQSMQTAASGTAAAAAAAAVLPSRLLDKWGICSAHPPNCPACAGGPAELCAKGGKAAASGAQAPSTLALMRNIARTEGAMALWRGTGASLLMAVPMVGIYFPLYDGLAQRLSDSPVNGYAPLVAGGAARTIAVLCTSPLELVRTRMQAHMLTTAVNDGSPAGALPLPHLAALHLPPPAGSPAAVAAAAGTSPTKRAGMWAHLPHSSSAGLRGRVVTLWTGVGATLARDVPFSALYWQLLEPIRGRLLPRDAGGPPSRGRVVAANLVSGSTAGAVAAAVTTPLDVVKTRAQLRAGGAAASRGSILACLRAIYAEGGVAALFSGVGPRAARAAPACAIVVASYEAIKTLYAVPDPA